MKIAFKKDIYRIDKSAELDYGLPPAILMERAAASAYRWIHDHWKDYKEKSFLILCGKGNNGGDARCLWELMRQDGVFVRILDAAKSQDWEFSDEWKTLVNDSDYIVDGIYGIGFRDQPPRGVQLLIDQVNLSQKPVLALDLPSGVYADGGSCERPIKAAGTVAFALPKWGCLDGIGRELSGHLTVDDIGLPQCLLNNEEMSLELVNQKDLEPLRQKRPLNAHKGTFGHLLVIGGNSGSLSPLQSRMVGAPVFNSLGALRAGAGLVTLASDMDLIPSLETLVPEALFLPLNRDDIPLTLRAIDQYIHDRRISLVLAGGGLGQGRFEMDLLEYLLSAQGPKRLILDADALNILSRRASSDGIFGKEILITPHLGEAARLMNWPVEKIQSDKPGALRALADKLGVEVLLKDSVSLIGGSNGTICVNTWGTPALAKGGSGDVLAGIAGGLGLRFPLKQAGVLASAVLGLSAQEAEKTLNQSSILATDLIAALTRVNF